jgi:hypothetical protein
VFTRVCPEPACPEVGVLGSIAHFALLTLPQMINTVLLHGFLWGMNLRSRRIGERAARQEEVFLTALVSLAITNLIVGLRAENSSDYVYATFLIICCASYLKVRWWLSMLALSVPTIAALVSPSSPSHVLPASTLTLATRLKLRSCSYFVVYLSPPADMLPRVQMQWDSSILPSSAKQHILVAWLAGGMMAWLTESYRRRTFAGQEVARIACAKELEEKTRHLRAQEELASAREEVCSQPATSYPPPSAFCHLGLLVKCHAL